MDRKKDKFILRWAKRYRAVQEMGGKCNYCEESNIFLLDFHHLDPSKKEFGISQASSLDWNVLKLELDKCVLVCSNCHRGLHITEVKEQFDELFDEIVEKSKVVHTINRPKLDEDYIYELLKRKHSISKISKILKKDPSTIRDIALRLTNRTGEKLFYTREEYNSELKKIDVNQLIELYKKGVKVKEMSKVFNCATSTLYNSIKKLRRKNLI